LTGQFNIILFINLSLKTPPPDNYLKKIRYITEFLRFYGGFVNIVIIKNGIDQGIKLFIFEKIYNKAVILSFISFVTVWFQKLLSSDIA